MVMPERLSDERLAAPIAGALLHRIVRFGRALREMDLTAALPLIDLGRREDFYYAARTTLLTRPDQREDFDRVFALFWPPTTMPLGAGDEAPQHAQPIQAARQPVLPVHQEHGEGIGLSIVKRLCELLNATIELDSVPRRGTTVRVLFPRAYGGE